MVDSLIENFMSGLYDFLSFALSMYNKFAQMATGMLGQDPAAFNSAGWNIVTNVNNVFLIIGAALVVIFFLMGFCSESLDIRQDFRIENILRMFIKLSIAEFFVINSMKIVRMLFALPTRIIEKLSGNSLTVNASVPQSIQAIANDPVRNGMSGWIGLLMVILIYIMAVVFLIVVTGCGMMILYEAYQRFFKIMMLIPYGTLANSTIAGNHMLNRSAEAFWKYALSTILEAVTMYLAMALSAAVLSSGSLGLTEGTSGVFFIFAWILESSFICMLTLGLVKGADMVTQKALGL